MQVAIYYNLPLSCFFNNWTHGMPLHLFLLVIPIFFFPQFIYLFIFFVLCFIFFFSCSVLHLYVFSLFCFIFSLIFRYYSPPFHCLRLYPDAHNCVLRIWNRYSNTWAVRPYNLLKCWSLEINWRWLAAWSIDSKVPDPCPSQCSLSSSPDLKQLRGRIKSEQTATLAGNLL